MEMTKKEEKKSEYQKLIELLNEYEKEIKKSEFYEWEKGIGGDTNLFRRDTRDEEGSHLYSDTADTYVISKKYGFIKWLVENDKINIDKMEEKSEYTFLKKRGGEHIIEDVLMLLAIQDEPIRFLCEIIK